MRLLAFTFAAALLAACPGPPPTPTPTLADIEAQVFKGSCDFGPCHTKSYNAGALVLQTDAGIDVAKALIGADCALAAARDAGYKRVICGDSAHSFLYLKLTGQLDAGMGAPMPYNNDPLPADRIAMVKAWIDGNCP